MSLLNTMSDYMRKQYADAWIDKAETWEEVDARTPPYTIDRVRGEYKNGDGKWVPFPDLVVPAKCQYCATPYEDDSGSCTKCGAPKEEVAKRVAVTWRI